MTKSHDIIAQRIWKYLDQDPCLRRNISRGLINIRALARYIIKEQKINTSIDAVISSIRRYKFTKDKKIFENAKKLIGQTSNITTRNHIASIEVVKDTEVQQLLPRLFPLVNYNRGDVLRIGHADESINIFVDEKNLSAVEKLIPPEKIIRIHPNLASINIRLKPETQKTPGIIAIIANEIAINNINVIDFMSCVSEFLWFVQDEDLLKVYGAFKQLWLENIDK
jgi:predicted regulator of amino acid metabolism with ACT domain